VGTRFSARPDRPWGPPSLLYKGYRVFPGGKVRLGRAADHSPPSSAAIMEEYSYTSTHPLGHTGPVTGSLYLFLVPDNFVKLIRQTENWETATNQAVMLHSPFTFRTVYLRALLKIPSLLPDKRFLRYKNPPSLRRNCSELFCIMTNKCTIISQINTLLHVSALSCHPQGACN